MPFSIDRFIFQEGINDSPNPSLVTKNQASSVSNVDMSEDGSIFKRLGSTEVATDANGSSIKDMYGYYTNDLTRRFMARYGTNLASVDIVAGAFTTVETGLTDSNTNFETFTNFLYYLNGSEFHRWDGTTVLDVKITDVNSPLGRYIKSFRNSLCVLGVTNDRSTLFYSDALDGTNWTTGIAGSKPIGGDDGDFGSGLGIVNDRLICFKTNSVWEFNFDSTGNAIVSPIHQGIGCISDGSIRNVPLGADDGLIFLGNDNAIYMIGQLPNYPLSNKPLRISTNDGSKGDVTETLKTINKAKVDIIRSFFHNFTYYIAFPTGGNVVNDTILAFDIRNKTWSKLDGFSPSSMLAFRQSDNFTIKPYFGDSSVTKIYELFADNVYSDKDANDYIGSWSTSFLNQGSPDRRKYYRDVFIEGFMTPSTTLKIDIKYDFEDTIVTKEISGATLFSALGSTLTGSTVGAGTIGTVTVAGASVSSSSTGWGSGQTIFHFDARISLEPRFAQQIKIKFYNEFKDQTFKLLNAGIEFKLRGRGNYQNVKKI